MNLNNIEFGMGATFRGRRSPALAWSCLVRTEDVKGRRISLDVAIDDGRIEDVLKIAQPLFRRRGGGSSLPIRISGPREDPEFRLDVRRALGPG